MTKLAPKAKVRPPVDDAELIARVSAGQVSALGELYDRHARALLRFASRAAGRTEAEDVVQTTFERAATAAPRYDRRAPSARSWLFGIAARIIQEKRRSVVRHARALLRLDRSRTAPPISDSRSDLETALGRLSENKRLVILLVEVEGFTNDEVARILGIPVGTVWTRLHHARRELRRFCEEGV